MNINISYFDAHYADFVIGSLFAILVGLVFGFAQLAFYRSLKIKHLVQQLHYQRNHDAITGLPNRQLLLDLIQQCIQSAQKKPQPFAVFLLDLDRFSRVNNLFGRVKGDDCLYLIAKRLREHLPNNYTIGRISGDEFLIVSDALHDVAHVIPVLNQLIISLVEPFRLYNHHVTVSCSIGVAIYPTDGERVDELLGHAGIALTEIKKIGRNGFQFFNKYMKTYTLDYLHIENQLRCALERQEFSLYYQPIFNIQYSTLVGFEALTRWNNEECSARSPDYFIPLAEEIGLIRDIDSWAMMTACCQLKEWHDMGFSDLFVAVNISAAQFKYGFLSENVMQILSTSNIPPESLEIELTEGVLIDDSDEVKQVLSELKKMNVSIAIDDFGTGYSCLSYLKRLDIHKLKIDKSFVMHLPQNQEDEILVKTIIEMAKRFKLSVVAEGVETKEQCDILKKLGCDFAQGYYFAKPMPADQCHVFLKKYLCSRGALLNKE